MRGCSSSKLHFMPAVDSRGYPVKGSCVLEDVGLVAVFAGLASPQPGKLTYHTQCNAQASCLCSHTSFATQFMSLPRPVLDMHCRMQHHHGCFVKRETLYGV